MRLAIIQITLTLFFYASLIAQDSTQTPSSFQDSGIKVTASIATKEIPLNRILKFTIQVEWFGNLNRYEISDVENPSVRNFEIKSNSSSDRREMIDGELKAIKTIEFDLIPKELGMGYIEGVVVKYIDTETGEGKHLITNRLEAKVIDPIPEPGSRSWIYKWIFIGLVLIGIAVVVIRGYLKKAEEKRRKAEYTPPVPIEEKYLNQLKDSVSLNAPDLDIKNAFSTISRLFREYLSEKYNFSAINALNEEICTVLKQNEVEESLINITEDILKTCDVNKFSGSDGDKTGLDRIYTITEEMLTINLKTGQEISKESE